MQKFMLRIAFIIFILALATAVFAASADNKPTASVSGSDKAALESAIDFKTSVETRWHLQDVVTATIKNPLSRKIEGSIALSLPGSKPETKKFSVGPGKSDSLRFELNPLWDGRSKVLAQASVTIEGLTDAITRTVDLGTEQRLSAIPACPLDRVMEFRLTSMRGRSMKGKLKLFDVKGIQLKTTTASFEVDGQSVVGLTLNQPAPKEFSFGYMLVDGIGRTILKTPVLKYTVLDDFSWVKEDAPLANYSVVDEVGSKLVNADGAKRETQYIALQNIPVCRLRYKFDAAGERFSLVPSSEITIADNPVEIGMWIDGDATGSAFSCRFVDSAGHDYQTQPIPVDWQGWRYKTISLDGCISTPAKLASLFTLDSTKPVNGTYYLGPVMLVSQIQAVEPTK